MNKLPENLLFLDTETTGREEQDRIFQVAYSYNGNEKSELFKPPLPLSIEAMEATHYTNKDVQDKDPFEGSQMHKELQEMLADAQTVFIAHNAKFDIEMLKREGIEVSRFIDTLKVARFLDPESKLGAYRLQYLRYALDLNVPNASAHDALGDVRVLIALFERLYAKMLSLGQDENEIIYKMEKISQEPSEIRVFTFGKYQGQKVADIAKSDPGYLQWLLKQKKEELKQGGTDTASAEDWIWTIEKLME